MWVESIDQDRSVCVRWRSAEGHSLKVQLLSARLLFLLTHTFVLNLVFIDTDCKMICAVMNSWTSCRRLREREKWIIVEMKGWTVLRRGGGWRWRMKVEEEKRDEEERRCNFDPTSVRPVWGELCRTQNVPRTVKTDHMLLFNLLFVNCNIKWCFCNERYCSLSVKM